MPSAFLPGHRMSRAKSAYDDARHARLGRHRLAEQHLQRERSFDCQCRVRARRVRACGPIRCHDVRVFDDRSGLLRRRAATGHVQRFPLRLAATRWQRDPEVGRRRCRRGDDGSVQVDSRLHAGPGVRLSADARLYEHRAVFRGSCCELPRVLSRLRLRRHRDQHRMHRAPERVRDETLAPYRSVRRRRLSRGPR